MKFNVLREIGYSTGDIYSKMGYGGINDPRLTKYVRDAYPNQESTGTAILRKIRDDNANNRGNRLAVSMVARELLKDGNTPNFNELLYGIITEGLGAREYGVVGRRYKSEGLMETMSKYVGLNEIVGRNLMQGMRFNGLYFARAERDSSSYLVNQIGEFAEAIKSLPPTIDTPAPLFV